MSRPPSKELIEMYSYTQLIQWAISDFKLKYFQGDIWPHFGGAKGVDSSTTSELSFVAASPKVTILYLLNGRPHEHALSKGDYP